MFVSRIRSQISQALAYRAIKLVSGNIREFAANRGTIRRWKVSYGLLHVPAVTALVVVEDRVSSTASGMEYRPIGGFTMV
jgi:hypothetical protein